ncbi:MAG TPA: 2-oxoglutarate oxidoreductase [Flavobacteriales bacterium]|jgi:2-oxoglutarate ferredoxin oxidoreductase subunit beta|nr:2-oxoglutarate oxidoreductase [Flavobacteriales bacterium]
MEVADIIKPENQVFIKTCLMTDTNLSYCPGCGHGTAHNITMEVIDELGIAEDTIGVAPVGCSVLAYDFMDVDMAQAAHGRAPALATAISRTWPNKYVFTYQGDGDLAAIGTAETIHACNRGENIVIIFVNNGIYGMTGGQMAPTTLSGMRTSTSPYGREIDTMGSPIKMSELIANLPGTYYVTRQAVHTHKHVRKAKKAIKTAFMNTRLGEGVSFVEIVSNCTSGWKMNPNDSNLWMEENMFPYFPLGDIKVKGQLK